MSGGGLSDDLRRFVGDLGLEIEPIKVPASLGEIAAFETTTAERTQKLRGELPGQVEQTRLYQRQTALAGRITDYKNFKKSRDEIGKKVRELDTLYGGREGLAKRREQIDTTLKKLPGVNVSRVVRSLTLLPNPSVTRFNSAPESSTNIATVLAASRSGTHVL